MAEKRKCKMEGCKTILAERNLEDYCFRHRIERRLGPQEFQKEPTPLGWSNLDQPFLEAQVQYHGPQLELES